ncbi:hypothetical protein DLAC_09103 [Tieghemostelium lacteum]|uniref:MRH domain-containing protein n=1 Tax=Tieghemostelium lacteum TaxID=361077 RepID=A0A151Z952_TIELA|nr:hypothetical protein DLAC_09103 [Tieghemostelium lacteum]|eukprot:KYQ90478.1 hypothetical protein DLAC_09103 [Tieghemostelium lacteum]
MKYSNLFLVCLILGIISSCYSQKCTATIEGNSFDLSPLMKSSGDSDYSYTDDAGNTFYFNLCNYTVSNPCGGSDQQVYAYKIDGKTQKCSVLATDKESWQLHNYDGEDETSVILEYKGGDQIKKFSKDRYKLSYVFHCDNSVGPGTPTISEIGEYSHVVVHWTSQYGCRKSSSDDNSIFHISKNY